MTSVLFTSNYASLSGLVRKKCEALIDGETVDIKVFVISRLSCVFWYRRAREKIGSIPAVNEMFQTKVLDGESRDCPVLSTHYTFSAKSDVTTLIL